MATEFDGSHVLISIHLQVWTCVSGHCLPAVSTHLIFVSSSWQETVLINFVEQVDVEIFSEAISTTKPTARKVAPHIHLYRILYCLNYFSLSWRMPNMSLQWVQMYSNLIRENNLIPVYVACSLSLP